MDREGLQWCCPGSVRELLEEWPYLFHISDHILWELIPFSLLWAVWLGRNAVIFQNKDYDPVEIWDMHILRIVWWIKAWCETCSYRVNDFSENFIHIKISKSLQVVRKGDWFPPPQGLVKFNVDGSARGSPVASGIGGILRNSSGETLGKFSKPMGILRAYQAEVQAILHALLFCVEFHIKDVIIESD